MSTNAETVVLAGIGQAEWEDVAHRPLNHHITAEEYMDLLVERQQVYLDASPVHAWVKPLLEWFIWPGDGDFVILPDRTTATPELSRTDADRLADAEAGVAR